MAISSTYYLNAPSLGSATAVFTDDELLFCAPDGFYSDGVISREQVGCVLLPQQICPSCFTSYSLGYSETSCEDACSASPVTYYSSCPDLILSCYLWTDEALTIGAPAGYYSDGINCYDYTSPLSGIIAITPCPPPPPIATIAFDFYDDGGGIIRARATVISGTTLDNLIITGTVNGYQSLGCSGVQVTNPSLSDTLNAGSVLVSTEVFGSISAILSAQYAPLIVNGNTILALFQNITVGGNVYTITGATNCYSPL